MFCKQCFQKTKFSLTKGSQTDAIYTDYSSAFTSVRHRLLLHKLKCSFNISGLALGWLESYLGQRSQRVILDGKHSDWTPVQSGVPEGSILGPLLFTCVADLPNHIKTSSLSYADDVKIFHRIKSSDDITSLQADLDRLSLWSKTWLLKLNPAKCKSITFTLTRALLGGGRLNAPPPGFSRLAKVRRRAAPPGFHPPYPPSFPQLL